MTDKQITRWFLAAVALVGLVYVCFELTPSSYGYYLQILEAPDSGPVVGFSRPIRSDEWSVITPLFQATVRNRFQRINETSFYHEDLRNYIALPLKDRSLPFKPQMWAFFVLPPASALAIYYALFMCGFLAGYHLLFRELGVPAWLAAAAALMVYFAGYTQFWWTMYCPLISCLPWILLIVLRPIASWKKALLCAWAFPVLVFGLAYPGLLLPMAWGGLILVLAFRPSLLRSRGDIAAVAAGVIAVALVMFFYFGDVLAIMRNTVYPGHRISTPGGIPMIAVFSEIFPFLSFRLNDYQHLAGDNICEIATVGSFLPLATLCLTRFRAVRENAAVRNSLLVLFAGFAAITLWELAPVPAWIGRILVWDRGPSQRWLFISGLLLTLAALLIWSKKLISAHPLRIGIFVVAGPIASLFLKLAWMMHRGWSGGDALSGCRRDILFCGLAIGVGLAAWFIPAGARVVLLVGTVALMNVYAFGRFNPLQPAGPIFDVPETDLVHRLRERAAASPGGVLVDLVSLGATLNGLGFRAVPHLLEAPQLPLFRSYFPAMDGERFNRIFNRYAHVHLTLNRVPDSPQNDVIELPFEVFVPVRNARRVTPGPAQPGACAQAAGGGIDHVSAQDAGITIDGWAPWTAETDGQGIRVLSARPLGAGALATIKRPDIAERVQDYGFVKSGFELQISSADGKAIRPEQLVLFAFGTTKGDIRLACCGCP
jgi:hypothetical protein